MNGCQSKRLRLCPVFALIFIPFLMASGLLPAFAADPSVITTPHTAAALLSAAVMPLGADVSSEKERSTDKVLNEIIYTPPVFSDSLPHMIQETNRKLADGVDPKQNAVVLLVQTFGADVFEPGLQGTSMEMLGLKSVPVNAPHLKFLERYVASQGTGRPADILLEAVLLEQKVMLGSSRFWNDSDLPGLKEYLEANEDALNVIVQASDLPDYFCPMLPEDEYGSMMSASVTVERRLPFVAKLLTARAIGRFRAGDFNAALADIRAVRLLARQLSNGSPFDISIVRASEIEGIATRGILAMLASGKLTRPQIGEFLAMQKELPPMGFCAKASDVGERAIMMRELEMIENSDLFRQEFFETTEKKTNKKIRNKIPELDWAIVRSEANRLQDLYVAAIGTPSRELQNQQFQKLNDSFNEWSVTVDSTLEKLAKEEDPDRKLVSEWVGKTMALSVHPALRMRRGTDDRIRNRSRLTELCLALGAYRLDHGKYPQKIEELVPGYVKSIPLDSYTDQPFVYKTLKDGSATLTSFGMNMTDDSGSPLTDDETILLP